ncbi:MAG: NADH-quinone oxidoreductase subunit N, partial [Gemmataceae bacterium]
MNDLAVAAALRHAFSLALPEIMMIATACVMFLGGTFRKGRDLWGLFGLLGLALGLLALKHSPIEGALPNSEFIYASPLFYDRLAFLIKGIAIVGGVLLVLFSWQEVSDDLAAEYHACILLIVAGVCLTATSNDLITLFLALELISIPTYVVLYIPRRDEPAQEAATKYFLLSVLSSAFLLFGFSYLYGLTGTTNIPAIIDTLQQGRGGAPVLPLALVALVMIVAGLGFKITAVPFHFYAPDVYQGTATVTAALLAFVPKVAGFVALVRVLGFVWAGRADAGLAFGTQLPLLLWILAAVTMTLGNFLALLQTNVKRLLAYSSVAHAGYMLIGLTVAQDLGNSESTIPGGIQAILFYLVAYGAMTIGAFAVLAYLSTPERPVETEDDLSGLGLSHPKIA